MRTILRLAQGLIVAIALLAATASEAWAQDNDKTIIDDLRARLEAVEKQNQQLLELLKPASFPSQATSDLDINQDGKAPEKGAPKVEPPIKKMVLDVLKEQEEKKKRDEEAKAQQAKDDGFEVGQFLNVKARWIKADPRGSSSSSQLWFETEDEAFRMHFGGRFHLDGVWATSTDRVQFGRGGIGRMDDAINWRRARLEADGWLYEVVDFFLEADFTTSTVNDDPTLPANAAINVINLPSLTDAWASVNHLPWIGLVRIGNQKPPILLEHLISSRYLDFMERSPLFDVYLNRTAGFQPGIQVANWTENERLTWQLGLFKNTQTLFPYVVGDGNYQVNGRITVLPWYEAEGRYMMHLGLGVQYDEPLESTGALLRDRWLLRNGPFVTQNVVAQAINNGHHQILAVPEFFMNLGPWSIQAEYLANHLDDITLFQTQTQGIVRLRGDSTSFFSQAAYVQVMYFLTGENRPYYKTALHASGAAPTRIVPYRNFFWVPGCGCTPFSMGAWQVGARYTYSDLSNDRIFGGQVNEVTLGLNWFLNPNMKIQWNYDIGYRGQLGPGSNSNGTFQGLGVRMACDF